MTSIKDDRGYNQGFKVTRALLIRTKRRCDVITENFDNKKANVLEIGCGIGLHAYLVAKRNSSVKMVGTDLCAPFIRRASSKFKLKNLRYEVLNLDDKEALRQFYKREGEFDYIYGDGILHHLYLHLESAIVELKKLLKPGGKLLFWEPNLLNPYCFLIFKVKYFRKSANLEPGESAFSKSFIDSILKRHGFGQIKVIHRDFLLPNTPNFLIKPSIVVGNLAEKVPIISYLSQSIFLRATLVEK